MIRAQLRCAGGLLATGFKEVKAGHAIFERTEFGGPPDYLPTDFILDIMVEEPAAPQSQQDGGHGRRLRLPFTRRKTTP